MEFEVHIVGDDDLPMEHDYCFIRLPGRVVFAVKRSRAASPWVLRDAWMAFRGMGESASKMLAVS